MSLSSYLCWEDTESYSPEAALRNTDLTRSTLLIVEAEPAASLRDRVNRLVNLCTNKPESEHRYVRAEKVYRYLRHHIYTRAKIWRLLIERSEAVQNEIASAVYAIPMRRLVSTDETHTAGGNAFPRLCQKLRNERCELLDRDQQRVPRTSTMVAVSMSHGVHWSETVVPGDPRTDVDWQLLLQCWNHQMSTCVPGLR